MNKIKILILAYACNPYKGSEPGVGWNIVKNVAKHCNTYVLTAEKNYQDINNYLKDHENINNLEFLFLKHNTLETFLMKHKVTYYLGYQLWQKRAYLKVLKLLETNSFDIVHQTTFLGFRQPGYLYKLKVPTIWGPIGGFHHYPWNFLIYAGLKGIFVEGIRNIINFLQLHFSIYLKNAINNFDQIIVSNQESKEKFKKTFNKEVHCIPELGINKIIDFPKEYKNDNKPLRILWSGNLNHHKALHILLYALKNINIEFKLTILGKGPLLNKWQNLAIKLGISSNCFWLGWLSHHEALEKIKENDIFVFTSLRDTSGNVALEALANGVPVICFDHQGVKDIVTDNCGYKIPLQGYQGTINKLKKTLYDIYLNKTQLTGKSRNALIRAKEYFWEQKIEKFVSIYQELIQ